MLDLSKRGYILFFMCHERPLCRRSKRIQDLINLQSGQLNSFLRHFIETILYFFSFSISISPLSKVTEVGVNHSSTTSFATEAYTLSPGAPISMRVPKELGSASGQGLETPPTVSDHAIARDCYC